MLGKVTFSPATAKWAKNAPGPAPGPSPTPTPTPTPAHGCDAQKDEADCEKAGCEWLAGIKVCIDKASTSPYFNAQSALAYTRAKQTNATSGYYSFTFNGDGCGGQCPTSGCYQEDLDCSYLKRLSSHVGSRCCGRGAQAHQMRRTGTMQLSSMGAPVRRSIALSAKVRWASRATTSKQAIGLVTIVTRPQLWQLWVLVILSTMPRLFLVRKEESKKCKCYYGLGT